MKDCRLDVSQPAHCYYLGAVLGDGTVTRYVVTIYVGGCETGYAAALATTAIECGWVPKTYTRKTYAKRPGVLMVSVLSSRLAAAFRRFKLKPTAATRMVSANSPWAFPERPQHSDHFVAGLIDTDGRVGKYETTISQRDHGGLDQVVCHLDALGLRYRVETVTVAGGPQKIIHITGRQNLRIVAGLPLRHPRKAAARDYMTMLGPGKRRLHSEKWTDPAKVFAVWADCKSIREASRRMGLCRATITRALRGACLGPYAS